MKRASLAFAAALAAALIVPQESIARPRGAMPIRVAPFVVPMRPVIRPLAAPRILPAAAHRAHSHHPAKPHAKPHARNHVLHRHAIARHHHPYHRKFHGALGWGLPFTAGAGVYYGNPALIDAAPDITGTVFADVPEEQNPERLRRVSIRYGTGVLCRSEGITVPSPRGPRVVTVTRC